MRFDSVLWGKNCIKIVRVIRVESGEVFPKYLRTGLEYRDQGLQADRYYGGAGAGRQVHVRCGVQKQ